MADREQEKYVFKGVKVTENQAVFVQKIADKKFEGNFSMALRSILSKARMESQSCK